MKFEVSLQTQGVRFLAPYKRNKNIRTPLALLQQFSCKYQTYKNDTPPSAHQPPHVSHQSI